MKNSYKTFGENFKVKKSTRETKFSIKGHIKMDRKKQGV
jgi:hypothetical protein